MDKKIITHNGSFHPDDIFAAAALLLYFEKRGESVVIVRTRDPEIIKTGDVVFDVGGMYDPAANRFDHHQEGGAGARPHDGIPYAAFGLVWKQFGEVIAGSAAVANLIDKKLVQPIDCLDNGFASPKPLFADTYPYLIDQAFFAFHPSWKEITKENEDDGFFRLVPFAKLLLEREMARATHRLEAEEHLKTAYESAADRRVLVLDREYPWKDFVSTQPEILFVVFPDGVAGTWGLSAVRKKPNEFGNRKDLPAAWAGKRESSLAEVSGVSDAIFCHNKLFFAVAKSKEGAVTLAGKALVG